jgi:hypothetical protein
LRGEDQSCIEAITAFGGYFKFLQVEFCVASVVAQEAGAQAGLH